MTNTIGATPEERELPDGVEAICCGTWNGHHSGCECGELLAYSITPETLESLISDRAKLREAPETADYRLHLIIEDAMDGGRSKEVAVYRAWQKDIRAALNTTKGQSNG